MSGEIEKNEKKKDIEEIDKCPECGSTQLVRDYVEG